MKMDYKKHAVTAFSALGMVAVAAAVSFAQEHGGGHAEGATTMEWVWRVVNFGIVFGALIYFVAKPFKSFLAKRAEDIETSLNEARVAREESLKRLADVEARLKDKDRELQSLMDVAMENGRKEKELLIAEAGKAGTDIVSSAKENIGAELNKAKAELRREAALMALELAEKMVRENIKKEDQVRILDEYMAKVGGK